jgi:hypothetical protein
MTSTFIKSLIVGAFIGAGLGLVGKSLNLMESQSSKSNNDQCRVTANIHMYEKHGLFFKVKSVEIACKDKVDNYIITDEVHKLNPSAMGY